MPFLVSCRSLQDVHRKLDFKELQRLTDRVLASFPASENVFIGLGRSPFPLIANLNEMEANCAFHVPLSYNQYTFRHYLPKELSGYSQTKIELPPYSLGERYEYRESGRRLIKDVLPFPLLRQQLFDHLDRFFPHEEAIKGRSIVLVDFCDYGTSLSNFYVDVTAYLSARGSHAAAQCLFISQRTHDRRSHWGNGRWFSESLERAGAKNASFEVIDLCKYPGLQRLFDTEALKPFAPYPHIFFDGTAPSRSATLRLNPLYTWFQSGLHEDFLRYHR
jgi:hypothetical protein